MSNTASASGGIGFFGLLTIVFITLKLLDVVQWSWWWVFAPLYIPLVVLLGAVIVLLILHIKSN